PVSTITPTTTTSSYSSRTVLVLSSQVCYGRRGRAPWSSVSCHQPTRPFDRFAASISLQVALLRSPRSPARNGTACARGAAAHRRSATVCRLREEEEYVGADSVFLRCSCLCSRSSTANDDRRARG